MAHLDLCTREVEAEKLKGVLQLVCVNCARTVRVHQVKTCLQLGFLLICQLWPGGLYARASVRQPISDRQHVAQFCLLISSEAEDQARLCSRGTLRAHLQPCSRQFCVQIP
jgi:hypothetical protein